MFGAAGVLGGGGRQAVQPAHRLLRPLVLVRRRGELVGTRLVTDQDGAVVGDTTPAEADEHPEQRVLRVGGGGASTLGG